MRRAEALGTLARQHRSPSTSAPQPVASVIALSGPPSPLHRHPRPRRPRHGAGRRRRVALRARLGAGQRPDRPHLDRHAARRPSAGVRLHEGAARRPSTRSPPTASCSSARTRTRRRRCPAHASLLSGRLPFETGVRDNVGFTVKPDERLLPRMLRDRGFATGGVVSAYVLRKETGIGQGFDFFDGEMPPASPEEPIGQVQRDGGAVGSDRRALARFDRHRRARSCSCTSTSRTSRTRRPQRFSQYAPYDGEIAYADEIVGTPRAIPEGAPAVRPLDDRAALGSRRRARRSRRAGARAVRLRRGDPRAAHHQVRKATPARAAASPTSSQHIDLVPTILDLVKAPMPGNLRGRSLKPLLDGSAATCRRGRSIPRRSTRGTTSAGAS